MLGFMILTVSDIKRSLAFYEAALKPLNIKFFLPYKGEDGHPDLWGFGDAKKAFFWLKQGSPRKMQSIRVRLWTGPVRPWTAPTNTSCTFPREVCLRQRWAYGQFRPTATTSTCETP
jgi:hypothetical protein